MQTLYHKNLKIVRGSETWINYQLKSKIWDCNCGGKYIQTFSNQTVCPKCPEYIRQKMLAKSQRHAIGAIN